MFSHFGVAFAYWFVFVCLLILVGLALPALTVLARSPNEEFKSSPKKVYCWQSDRDGGGWTLGLKNWYGSHHSFAGGGRRQTNNINSGVMDHMGQYCECVHAPPVRWHTAILFFIHAHASPEPG
jgi:hypothetical protein